MAKNLSVALFVLFAVATISHVYVLDDQLSQGEDLVGHVGIWNPLRRNVHDVTITMQILETGEFRQIAIVDVDKRSHYGQYFVYELPKEVKPGEYVLKINARSKSGKRLDDTKYQYFTVR